MSPTERSLKHLRNAGYLVAIVEHWNPFAKVRHDLFGFIDLLCVNEAGTLAVQTTTLNNMKARVMKILEHKNFMAVVDAGWTIRVHGWKAPTKKHPKWSVRELDIAAHGIVASVGDKL
jgi:hypothetical protein